MGGQWYRSSVGCSIGCSDVRLWCFKGGAYATNGGVLRVVVGMGGQWYRCSVGCSIGCSIGCSDVRLWEHPKGAYATIGRVLRVVVGMGGWVLSWMF